MTLESRPYMETRREPTPTRLPVWRHWTTWLKGLPSEVRTSGALSGIWPENTPRLYSELYRLTTPQERIMLLLSGDEPSFTDVMARSPRKTQQTQARTEERWKSNFALLIGEPPHTHLSFSEIEEMIMQKYKKDEAEKWRGISTQEQRFINVYYGLRTGHLHTPTEAASIVGISQEEAERIQRDVLPQLLAPFR